MRSLMIFASLFLSINAFAETTAMSIGEIDSVIRAEAPTPAVIQPMLPATLSEYFFLPARGQTAAQLSFGQMDGTTISTTGWYDSNNNPMTNATDVKGTSIGITIDRSISNNLYLGLNVQNQSINMMSDNAGMGASTGGNVSFQKFGLGLTKIAPLAQGNLLFGARLATYVTSVPNGDTFDQYQAVPFIGYEQTSRGAAWGGEIGVEQYLKDVKAVARQTAFYEIPAATKFMLGAKAGLNQTAGLRTGYQGGIYSKYTPVADTDIRLAVDTENVASDSNNKLTTMTVAFRRTL